MERIEVRFVSGPRDEIVGIDFLDGCAKTHFLSLPICRLLLRCCPLFQSNTIGIGELSLFEKPWLPARGNDVGDGCKWTRIDDSIKLHRLEIASSHCGVFAVGNTNQKRRTINTFIRDRNEFYC